MKDGPFDRPDSRFNTLKGWTWIGCYGGYYLQSDLLHEQGFEHGFFTRLWHGRGPDELAGYVSAGMSIHRLQQIHSGIVLNASDARQDPWPEADGLVSDRGGQSLWVCGADCTPVLIADPGTGHAAACHAGWRGVAAEILITALDQLVNRGAQLEDLVIALGPAVSGPRYQVGDEVVKAIAAAIPGDVDLSERGAVSPDEQPGRHRLDIRAAASLQLQQAGISGKMIAHCPLCTVSEPELFHSWRRDQVKAVQWSGIVAQAPNRR
ncbi:copper oxidase [Synechococcus sp. KORDI-52]|uniref:peptidoglycan editing factor PgeF n=1 Tax=Synechococcus sp. KORDI-52 TaxID=585425 RepID=UPI0004E08941|nr:peptidoglycan editing factor PgeF [Synechococcus sp. KORDI-52]AII50106.1 copper oxidase [Synechococcus sp. KORDI-52]